MLDFSFFIYIYRFLIRKYYNFMISVDIHNNLINRRRNLNDKFENLGLHNAL